MQHRSFPKDKLSRLFPVIEARMSDSGSLDNLLEWLYHLSDRSLPECIMSLIPEPWHKGDPHLEPNANDAGEDEDDVEVGKEAGGNESPMLALTRAFYKWSACSLEPWDGPGKL
ncbi:unnamed protein product [Protopolystoma xenopodis]|uniref:Glutamine amidotransferase type-2 domain-containing protein n=1 Tax=Protopolystoma xenopodis TaxID=117903 RepID=A0A448XMI1_9PLAT|nr:unnamed protein product [Protopolystoma xenopodis]